MKIACLFLIFLTLLCPAYAENVPGKGEMTGTSPLQGGVLFPFSLDEVPPYARAAAWINGEKLLENKAYFQLFNDLLPGLRKEKFSPADLSHFYLFFASEDLRLYGVLIRKGKGSLDKLHTVFKKAPASIVRLHFSAPRTLLVIWGSVYTPALKCPRRNDLFNFLKKEHLISATGFMTLEKLSGNAPKKLLKEFPELKRLRRIQLDVAPAKHKTEAFFIFDNTRSPGKFPFLNWGLTFLLWHKTSFWRTIDQDVKDKQLCLTVYDPPFGRIARVLTAASTGRKQSVSTQAQLKKISLLLHLYALENNNRLPDTLEELHPAFLPDPLFLKELKEKKRFLYFGKNMVLSRLEAPARTLLVLENPALLPAKGKHITAVYADGRVVRHKIKELKTLLPEPFSGK
jgi:hypothetical protein